MTEWLNKCHFGDVGDVLRRMIAGGVKVNTIVTSSPYFGLRDYGHSGQIGLESTPEEFIAKLVSVFSEVRRVLRDDGTLWLNMGDSYAGGGGGSYGNKIAPDHGQHTTNVRNCPSRLESAGLKAKDLIGVPWMLAFSAWTGRHRRHPRRAGRLRPGPGRATPPHHGALPPPHRKSHSRDPRRPQASHDIEVHAI